jgi:hypothetical protein
MGAQAITGAFKTISVAVAEAEASITPVGERHAQVLRQHANTVEDALGCDT